MNREFTISTGMKIMYGIIAAILLAVALFFSTMPRNPEVSPAVLLLPLTLLLGSILIFINLFKRRVIITSDSITNCNVFLNRTLYFTDIKGCRVGQKGIIIESLSHNRRIIIGNYSDLGNSEELATYLKEAFTNLDSIDLKQEEQNLLQDNRFGNTIDERQRALKNAKTVAIVYNIIASVAGFATIFISGKYTIFSIQSIVPLIGIIIMAGSKGLIKFLSETKRSPYPFIGIGFMFPSMMSCFISFNNYDILKYQHFWLYFILVTSFIVILLVTTGINKTSVSPKGQVFMMIVIAILYGSGCTVQINCVFDKSLPKQYKTRIAEKYTTSGKGAHYHIKLQPWENEQSEPVIDITESEYSGIKTGSFIVVYEKSGYLNIPWFYTDI